MRLRLWNGFALILIILGFLILLFGLAALLNDHPNQGHEIGLGYLKMASLAMGPGAIMIALPHWWKRTPHDGAENHDTRKA